MSTTDTPTPDAPSLLDRLRARFATSTAEMETVQAQIESRKAEAAKLSDRLTWLMKDLEAAEASLELAERRFEERKCELPKFEEIVLTAWGESRIQTGPDYGYILALRASIQDFPRARMHLLGKVTTAKKAITEFERKHGI